MTKRRKRKQESSGSLTTLFEIMFGGIAGAAIAAVWLVLKPVDIVDRVKGNPDEVPARHAINYQPGKVGLVRESQVKQKEQAILQGSAAEVSLSEQEINRWLATRYGASSAKDVMGTGVEVRPEPPLVRMVGDEMQIGIVYSFSGYDGKKNMVLQTTGHFDRTASGKFEFVSTKAYLGSCPLPTGFVSRFVLEKFLSGFAVSDELSQAWSGLRDVALTDGHLKLQFGGAAPAPAPEPEPVAVSVAAPAVEGGVPVNGALGNAEGSVPEGGVLALGPDMTASLPKSTEDAVVGISAVESAAESESVILETEALAVEAAPVLPPVEGAVIDAPAEIEETVAPAPAGEGEVETSAVPVSDGFETMTIESGTPEEVPASAPVESN